MTAASPSTPPPAWADQGRLLIDLALADLDAGHPVLPTMVAFRGDDALFLTTLRPFASGEHHDPIIEVGAVALTLGADRLALSLSGRAWSLRDPIPPVLSDGSDLRQQVIVIHLADAVGEDPLCLTTIVPVDVDDDGVSAGPPLTDVAGEGWVPQALLVLARDPMPRYRAEDLAAQVVRCERLGHRFAWAPATCEVVELARLEWLCRNGLPGGAG